LDPGLSEASINGGEFMMTHKDESTESGNITIGNISHATGVAIGHGAQATVNQGGNSEAEIAKAFAAISEKVTAMPEGPKKVMAQAAVQGLEKEARNGEQADEAKVNEWMGFLAQIASDAFDVAVATFANPIAGIGLVFKKIADRAREEKSKK
jgi:hypothetical protein